MTVRSQSGIVLILDQDGPFATRTAPPGHAPFGREARSWCRAMAAADLATRYRIIRNQIFEFLDVQSFADIQILIRDQPRRRLVSQRANRLLANLFGIEGTEREILSKIGAYSRTADAVIRYLQGKVLSRYAPHIEMTNEIDAMSSPVDLLLIVFDDRYHQKARFEAKRKLVLMSLAGSIDQRERETDIEAKFLQFLDFLNDQVWSQEAKIGELEVAYLLSHHDPETFACQEVRVVSLDEGPSLRQPGAKLTLIKRRRFRANGRQVPIYVSIRKKAPEAKVLKLLRKREENPAVAVDDELGLMAVLDSPMEVKLFQTHLTRSAIRASSFMTLEEVADTLGGGRYESRAVGSSAHTPMFKFFARMGGMRVEFIVHTNRSYLNYMYQRGVAHDEYEVRRIFDSGVARLLFPQAIYDLDMDSLRDEILGWFRHRLERP
ncbi:MAG: hypothetical protein AB1634_02690 [Thermodesulfobacteriota bacterium]